ncbi:STAS domain-containing protein [Leptospira bourretii]|uniref:STAS domain-containing protein n=1 Tax=Leptospira bourretii TaxID=2484962 RepID=A0A4R9IQC0_9LEPT|nr:STAS domain-containing protein [Leptospira bourretii]TGK82809.1 STAS domain-containing protein [Leptospira bourretii]TGK94154.1 STAS domain-containing protein [Leptospira bourretii]TGL26202.1 STAS domain-containing protein [Leptospira bourretii]TGL28074.1 STAS domain-containing protein [Leptospira bourretii]
MASTKYKKVVVVFKRTKYELDLETYGSIQAYKEVARQNPEVFQRTFESHERQLESRNFLKSHVFPNADFVFRENFDPEDGTKYDLIVAHGGDNHFTYVAHLAGNTHLIGCNSDPQSSVGALLGFTAEELMTAVKNNFHHTQVESWSLLDTEILYPNGTKLKTVPAICELSIRNNSPDLTSRFWISYQGQKEEQKCSGLLVYTGAGSTGWISSCFPKKFSPFSKHEPFFHVYSREIRVKSRETEFSLADFRALDQVEVISEMNGGLAVDSLTERHYPFPPYAKATIRLSPEKLSVIVPLKRGESMQDLPYEIEQKRINGTVIVQIKGRMESGPLDRITQTILDEMVGTDRKHLILDFSELRYISSLGIRMILDVKMNLQKRNKEMALVGVTSSILQVFHLLGLSNAFQFYADREEALKSFEEPSKS